jgi:hypothetical protein
MKYIAFLHPYLFALGSVLFLYPGASIVASPDQMLRPLIVMWLVLTCIIALTYSLMRDITWVPIFGDVVILGFCSHNIFFVVAGGISLLILLLFYVSYRFLKKRVIPRQINMVLILVASLLNIVLAVPLTRQWINVSAFSAKLPAPRIDLKKPGVLPDIYYIVLDGYGRTDLLAELYGFDNSDFVKALEARNFIIPDESRSNYPKTALSITSTLNMDYIQDLAPGLTDQYFWWLMSPLIRQSLVRENLESLGYTSVAIATDWGITNNTAVEEYYAPSKIMLNDFEAFLISSTPLVALSPVLKKIMFVPDFDTHGELILYNFTKLAEIAEMPGSKFVFAHILAPHPPFVFGSDGTNLQPDYPFSFNDANDFPYDDQSYRDGYIGQVQFVNSQIIPVIDAILNSSDVPPIIILQADHGPGMLTDFNIPAETCLKERFSVFAAYYLPGTDSSIIPSDITPVNLFRIIFNQYFSAEMPVLESRHYVYRGARIFSPMDITSQVDTCHRE